jgi:hypothetical protein
MRNPDEDIDENENVVPEEVRDYVEQLPGYQEHLREIRGDALNFGDM